MSLLLLLGDAISAPPDYPLGGDEVLATRPVKYATAVTIPFSMVKRGLMDLAVTADWTPATGDTKISIDGAAFINTTNNPAIISGTDWGLALETTEVTGKVMTIQIIDQSSPKVVEDQKLYLTTKGHASAYEPFDTFTALSSQTVSAVSGAVGSVTGNVGGDVSGNVTGTVGGFVDPPGMKKAAALPNWTFEMRDATTGLLKTGLTVTARRRIDGGSWAACTNSPSETAEAGMYTIDLDAADTNGAWIVYKFTATGAIETIRYVLTEP